MAGFDGRADSAIDPDDSLRYDPTCGRADHNACALQHFLRPASCQVWPSTTSGLKNQ